MFMSRSLLLKPTKTVGEWEFMAHSINWSPTIDTTKPRTNAGGQSASVVIQSSGNCIDWGWGLLSLKDRALATKCPTRPGLTVEACRDPASTLS